MLNINVEKLSDRGCDIVQVNSNKGKGILHLMDILNQNENLNLSKENVLYFGDNYNDRSVFELFPYTIAMEHAPNEILNLAYDVAGNNNTAGIYHYLSKIEEISN